MPLEKTTFVRRTPFVKKLPKSRGIALGAAIVAMMLLGVVSWRLGASGMEDFVGYRSPYTFDVEPGEGTERLTRTLVLVIVDGLGFPRLDEMQTLKDLGSRGVAFSLAVDEPSLSLPGWTTLLTGAGPEISGVTTNFYEGRAVVDSLFGSAARAGIKAVLGGDEAWRDLFGDAVARAAYHETTGEAASRLADDAVLEWALGELGRGEAGLIVAHFSSVDAAGHASGARGAAYRSAAAEVDARLARLLSALDLTTATMLVTSDHGHTASGGHGGWEDEVTRVPLVAAGAGIVTPADPDEAMTWASARHVDVAPTCAALLGVSVPAHSQGAALLDALDAREHVLSERAIRQARARAAFAEQYLAVLDAKPLEAGALFDAALLHNDGKYGEAAATALEVDREIIESMSRARERFIRSRGLASAVVGALVLGMLALGAVALWHANTLRVQAPALGAACYFALFNALVAAKGVRWSLSAFNKVSDVAPFFAGRSADSAVSGVLAAAVIAWLVRRGGRKRPGDAFVAGVAGLYLVAGILVVQIVAFTAAWGARFTQYLPDLRCAFEYYARLLQVIVVGALSPAFGALSAGASWALSRIERAREDAAEGRREWM